MPNDSALINWGHLVRFASNLKDKFDEHLNEIDNLKLIDIKDTANISNEVKYENYNPSLTASPTRALSQTIDINNIMSISVSGDVVFGLTAKNGSNVTYYWTGTQWKQSDVMFYTNTTVDIQTIAKKSSGFTAFRIYACKSDNTVNITPEECRTYITINAITGTKLYNDITDMKNMSYTVPVLSSGAISSTGGLSTNTARVSTENIIVEGTNKVIVVEDDYEIVTIDRYSRIKGWLDRITNGITFNKYLLEAGYSYRVCIQKKSDPTATITANDVSKFVRVYSEFNFRELDTYDEIDLGLRQGFMGDNGGLNNTNSAAAKRVCSEKIYATDADVLLTTSNGYYIRTIDRYGLSAGHDGKVHNGLNISSYVLPKGYRYAITYINSDDSAFTAENIKGYVHAYRPHNVTKTTAKDIFAKYISSGKSFNVKLIGDSILQGVNGTGFAQDGDTIITANGTTWKRNPNGYCWGNLFKKTLESNYSCTVVNNGCRGVDSNFIINNWSTLVSSTDDIIICAIGTNDRGFTSSKRTFEANIRTIQTKAKNAGKDIIFISGIPAGLNNELNLTNNYTNVYYTMGDVDALIAEATRNDYISLYKKVKDWEATDNIRLTDYLDSSELHPNDELYWKMYVWICNELGLAPEEYSLSKCYNLNTVNEKIDDLYESEFSFQIPLEVGALDGSGNNITGTTRCRTTSSYLFLPGLNIIIPEGYKCRVMIWLNNSFNSMSTWKTNGVIPLSTWAANKGYNGNLKFKLLIGKLDDSVITTPPTIYFKSNPVPKLSRGITTDILRYVSEGYAVDTYGAYPAEGYYCSVPVPVTNGETYKAGAIRNYLMFDSNLQSLGIASGSGGSSITLNKSNVAYIIFCWKNTDPNYNKMSFSKSSDYIGGYLTGGTISPLAGKTLIWTGDSIPHGQVASGTAPTKPYPQIVAENLGMNLINYSIGGSTIAHKSNFGGCFSSVSDFNSATKDTTKYYQVVTGQTYTSYRYSAGAWTADTSLSQACRTPLIDRYQFMSNSADIICVAAGTNDFQYNWTDIGSISAMGSTFDKTTFYGALQFLIEGLISKYPGKTIIFCTPIKRAQTTTNGDGDGNGDYGLPTSKNAKNKSLKEYGEIIKEVCDLYSLPVIDLYSTSGLNPALASQSSLFDTWKTHPFQTGHNMIANVCTGQIKSYINY